MSRSDQFLFFDESKLLYPEAFIGGFRQRGLKARFLEENEAFLSLKPIKNAGKSFELCRRQERRFNANNFFSVLFSGTQLFLKRYCIATSYSKVALDEFSILPNSWITEIV